MRHEIRRVEPLRAANVTALVYGLLMGIVALVFAPFFVLVGLLAPGEGPGPLVVFFVVLYPLMGLVMGWISGILMSAIYNVIIRWTGGILVDLEGVAPPATHGPA